MAKGKFVRALFQVLQSGSDVDIVCWGKVARVAARVSRRRGQPAQPVSLPAHAVVILNVKVFMSRIMPQVSLGQDFAAFRRQLSHYGFVRVPRLRQAVAFIHEAFRPDRPDLLDGIRQRRCKAGAVEGRRGSSPAPSSSGSVRAGGDDDADDELDAEESAASYARVPTASSLTSQACSSASSASSGEGSRYFPPGAPVASPASRVESVRGPASGEPSQRARRAQPTVAPRWRAEDRAPASAGRAAGWCPSSAPTSALAALGSGPAAPVRAASAGLQSARDMATAGAAPWAHTGRGFPQFTTPPHAATTKAGSSPSATASGAGGSAPVAADHSAVGTFRGLTDLARAEIGASAFVQDMQWLGERDPTLLASTQEAIDLFVAMWLQQEPDAPLSSSAE